MTKLDDIVEKTYSHLPTERAGAAIKLGKTRDKNAFKRLVQMTMDTEPYVAGDAIIALGELQDSRAYFVLANLFSKSRDLFREHSVGMRKRILNAFGENQDPRAKDLARHAMTYESLKEIAEDTLQKIESRKEPFVYRYNGEESRRQVAEMNYRRFLIRDYPDLEKAIPLIEQEKNGNPSKPQTYIITTDHKMFIGGDVHEHVDVAQGEDILAAGEAFFEKHDKWIIKKINNRSYGYFPDKSCYSEIKKALENSGITFPAHITPANPPQGWMDQDMLDWNWEDIKKIYLK